MLIQVSMDNGTSFSDLMFYIIQQKYVLRDMIPFTICLI